MAGLVRARRSFFIAGRTLVRAGQIRRSDDPLVEARVELFEPVEDSVVEQATAAPGEKRNVVRKHDCPVEGCDYSGTKRGLDIHTAKSHGE